MEDERLKRVARGIRGDHVQVLNVGFGSGNLEQLYFKEHPQASIHWYGIDISTATVQKVRREHPTGTFSVGNILHIKFPKDHFDYVIALEVLEHIPPSRTFKALSEIRRVAKPGGYIILSVPLNEGLEEMIAKDENPNAHVRIYTPALIRGELIAAGFRVLDQKLLFAFHGWYTLKSIIAKYSGIKKWCPNNIIVRAQKPDSLGCGAIKYNRG